MIDLLIVLCAVVLLVGVLTFEKKGATTRRAALKGCVSLLFVVTALVQPHPVPAYYCRILAGLVFGLIGDVCLAIPGNRSFRAGLFAFLAGHLLYVWAFSALAPLENWVSPVQLIFIAFSLASWSALVLALTLASASRLATAGSVPFACASAASPAAFTLALRSLSSACFLSE